jgi:hypothetical protein
MMGATEVLSVVDDKATEDSRDHARNNVAEWDALVRQAIQGAQLPSLQKIAPYFVTERRTLAKGDSDVIKDANKTAARGEWQAAAKMWSEAGQAGTGKDRVAARYNLGVYAEVEGRLDDALKLFQQARNESGNEKYATDIARVEQRMAEEAQIRAAREGDASAAQSTPAS